MKIRQFQGTSPSEQREEESWDQCMRLEEPECPVEEEKKGLPQTLPQLKERAKRVGEQVLTPWVA